jgi:hypothetical protein
MTHIYTRISNEVSKFYKVRYFAYCPNTLIYFCVIRDIIGRAMAGACLCGDLSSISDQSFLDLCWSNVTVTGFSANNSAFPSQYNLNGPPYLFIHLSTMPHDLRNCQCLTKTLTDTINV